MQRTACSNAQRDAVRQRHMREGKLFHLIGERIAVTQRGRRFLGPIIRLQNQPPLMRRIVCRLAVDRTDAPCEGIVGPKAHRLRLTDEIKLREVVALARQNHRHTPSRARILRGRRIRRHLSRAGNGTGRNPHAAARTRIILARSRVHDAVRPDRSVQGQRPADHQPDCAAAVDAAHPVAAATERFGRIAAAIGLDAAGVAVGRVRAARASAMATALAAVLEHTLLAADHFRIAITEPVRRNDGIGANGHFPGDLDKKTIKRRLGVAEMCP